MLCEVEPPRKESATQKPTDSAAKNLVAGNNDFPFFARGVSPGDLVKVRKNEGELIFDGVVSPSSSSVFRIFVTSSADVQVARDEFRELGCESELSHITRLFAVEVPGTVDFSCFAELLAKGTETGRWKYEEAVLRHSLPRE